MGSRVVIPSQANVIPTAVQLPSHCATADEPIPPRGHREWAGPDMREVMPLSVMLAELAHVGDDDVAVVELVCGYVRQIGCTLMAHYNADGELALNVGFPCDPQARHRNRSMHYLLRVIDQVEGRGDYLIQVLIDLGQCWDERPVNPRATTAAVRDFIAAKGRILIDPMGKLGEGGEIPCGYFSDDALVRGEVERAGRAYFDVRNRYRSDYQIKRAARMLGRRTSNGWIVLELKS